MGGELISTHFFYWSNNDNSYYKFFYNYIENEKKEDISMTDYGQILCQAVNEIVESKLAGLEYDITKNCTIISVQNQSEYRYIVSDGSSSFEAVAAEGSTYKLGEGSCNNTPRRL